MKISTAESVRVAIREREANARDGLYTAIEAEIARMQKNGDTNGAVAAPYGLADWLLDEVIKAYTDAGFVVSLKDFHDDRDPRSGGRTLTLHVPAPSKG